MTQYLLNLTIGPVQGFIAQARKTQDLFAGSRMLSDLARKGFELVQAEFGNENVDLIFPEFGPATDDDAQGGSNPNRFSVLVSTAKSAEEIGQAGQKIKQRLIDHFVGEGLKSMPPNLNGLKIRAERQLRDQLSVFWAAVPLGDNGYRDTFKQLEKFINGAKNYRPFTQLEEAGRKCSVDGQRNVILYRRTHQEPGSGTIGKFPLEIDFQPAMVSVDNENAIKIQYLQPGEGLSAVSYAKRVYKWKNHEFPSTARICLLHELHAIKKAGKFEEWDEFITYAGTETGKPSEKQVLNHSDDQLFFKENINESVFLKSGQFGTDKFAARNAAQEFLKQYETVIDQIKSEPEVEIRFSTKYYGLIIFDGDGMGDWLDGSNLEDGSDLMAFHKRMAKLLHRYGEEARKFLQEPKGKTVYAGGDDFLGFLNLMDLLGTVGELRKMFHEMVHVPLMESEKGYTVKPGKVFSFSAGIAIGHYKQPLGMVLDEAREAEKLAKKHPGKDALAITLIRHSGGNTSCVRGFGEMLWVNEGTKDEKQHYPQLRQMQMVIQALADKKCSNKFIHTLIRETQFWKPNSKTDQFEVELKRLLMRAWNSDPRKDKEAFEPVREALLALLRADRDQHPDPESALENFLSTLRIIDFIYRITNDNEE